MSHEKLEVRPSKNAREVLLSDGRVLKVPDDWDLLLPGDAALSRRIKKDGPTWTMYEMKGRKRFSRGIWAPAERIDALEQELKKRGKIRLMRRSWMRVGSGARRSRKFMKKNLKRL